MYYFVAYFNVTLKCVFLDGEIVVIYSSLFTTFNFVDASLPYFVYMIILLRVSVTCCLWLIFRCVLGLVAAIIRVQLLKCQLYSY